MNGKYVWNGKEVDRKTWWRNRLQMVVEDPTNDRLEDLLMDLDLDSEVGHSMYNLTPEEGERGDELCRITLTDDEQVALGNLGVTIWDALEGGLNALNKLTNQLPSLR